MALTTVGVNESKLQKCWPRRVPGLPGWLFLISFAKRFELLEPLQHASLSEEQWWHLVKDWLSSPTKRMSSNTTPMIPTAIGISSFETI